ncbi:hypothetical protein Syun_004295 [Stephania yunnanensis]|uniref:Beta-glucosidase n=1 Tax=Stephania yunnanensis TaxID=152371 RepID=A0AAP0L2T0_9MAGN
MLETSLEHLANTGTIASETYHAVSKSLLQRDSTSSSNPRSLQRLLEYVNVKYKNPAVVIHENGITNTAPSLCNRYICRNGSDVRGYFVWSFMDCFELLFGYKSHYGLYAYAVDFNHPKRKRYPRMSARWFSSFLAKEKNNAGISSH